jgi:hypothetical protein
VWNLVWTPLRLVNVFKDARSVEVGPPARDQLCANKSMFDEGLWIVSVTKK